MKKTIFTILKYLLFFGLGIWIIYHMLHQLSDQQRIELTQAIKNANAWYLIPIFLIGFLSHFFRAIRWRYLLETVDLKPSVTNTTFAVLIGYIANMVLPRAGEVAKCTVLAKYEKAPVHKMIGTIVAERAFDMVCLLVIAALAFVLQAQFLGTYLSAKTADMQAKFEHSKVLLIILGIGAVVAIPVAIMLYKKYENSKIGQFVKEMLGGIFSIIRMKKRWAFLGYTVLIWSMYLLQLWIGFWCLPETAGLSLTTALVVLVYGSIGMIVTPGGIGLYTLLVAQMLVAYSVPEVPAQAFGWIAWVAQTAVILVLGLGSLLAIQPYNRKRYGQAAMDTA
ncbi:lysylphosphatidylglycerol synthase transmembrane domain-containing protein [Nemorincola caseinilytica]|uniref:Lysylphosphatidylglycerol synthase transmembrane domain-containing protein n=1 Tax=Nemorincola caseinilytica TaxID=2054315 RepID=A0ABP8NIP2_9BACT